jgi:hypothetical protein
MIEAILQYLPQQFCRHHWIWHFREMECSKCLKRYPIDAKFLAASGPYTDAARATARRQLRGTKSEQPTAQFRDAKNRRNYVAQKPGKA